MLTGESERKEWKKLTFDLLPSFFFPASACSLCLHSVFFSLTFSASFVSFFSAHFSVAVSICMFASSPLVPAFYARAVLLFLYSF